jgi:glycerol-3-phosphate dehydrogenase
VDRSSAIESLRSEQNWDIIVVGGGATGLGIAVDAAKRGFKTLLLEKYDFAKGTSSRSTKLVHGGVRYLAQGNIKLVVEALRERGFMLANAPHLTRIQHFVIPAYSYFSKWFYGIGLFLYDLLSRKLSLGHPALLSKKSVLKKMPMIQPKGLKGGVLYADGQFDDARMAIALALTANELGATVVNYVQVTSLIKEKDKVVGVIAEDELMGEVFTLKAKVVINATGVFADSILDMDDPDSPAMVMPSQGVHLVVDQRFFPGTDALMIPKTKDGRVLFALPWHGKVVIGTTDTALNIINEEPIALDEEVAFILMHFNEYATSKITRKDILSIFAGLRPLVKTSNLTSTSLASRDHTIIVSKSNLITITGGKWTTYRKMAKDAVNNAAFVAKLPVVKCTTRKLKLHGYTNTLKYGDRFSAYGSDADLIQAMINEHPTLAKPMHPKYDYCQAELEFSVRNEMAMTVEDILARRSRLLFIDAQAAIDIAPLVAQTMAKLLNEDQQWEEEQVSSFLTLADGYLAVKS